MDGQVDFQNFACLGPLLPQGYRVIWAPRKFRDWPKGTKSEELNFIAFPGTWGRPTKGQCGKLENVGRNHLLLIAVVIAGAVLK